MAVLLLGAWGSLATVISLGPAAAADACAPTQHTDAIKTLSLDDITLQGSQAVRIDFDGALPDGSCSGDVVELIAPPNFPLTDGAQPVLDPDGVPMGTMTVSNNVVTITFNDYVQTHDNITFGGHFYGRLSGSKPDTGYDLNWDLGGGASIVTPVTTNVCVNCSGDRTTGLKFASLTPAHDIVVYFDSAVTKAVGEVVTFTDVLGPGQRMDCTRFHGAGATSRSPWGSLIFDGDLPVTIVSCDDGGFTATMTSTAVGQYLDLQTYAFTTDDRTTYPDTGTVTQDGHTDQVSAVAREYTANVNGDGDVRESDESEAPTPDTPTPPVTAPPVSTAPPVVTGSPAIPPATPTNPTTPATTPPTATPVPHHRPTLPATGLDPTTAASAVSGVALLAAGIVLVCTGRRRRANPS